MKAYINSNSIIKFYAPTNTDAGAYFDLAKQVGGATAYYGRGIWWSSQGELFNEECTIIEIVHPCPAAESLLQLVEKACKEFLRDNPQELATLATIQGDDGVKSVYLSREA